MYTSLLTFFTKNYSTALLNLRSRCAINTAARMASF